jgi:hypothetical protein
MDLIPAEEGLELLTLARRTAEHALKDGSSVIWVARSQPRPVAGLFVTFWAGRRLRGCVGTVSPSEDLFDCIQKVSRASLADPRFCDDPITLEELDRLTIELSVLSEPFPLSDIGELIPGRHGVIVRLGERSGCFLPKVAVDKGWSAEEFLSNCCSMKAGLPPGAWRDPATQVRVFTVQRFCEPGPTR